MARPAWRWALVSWAVLASSCGGAPLATPAATEPPQPTTRTEALVRYCIDKEASSVAAVAFAMGTRHVITIVDFSGEVWLSEATNRPKRLSLTVDLASARGATQWMTDLVRSERFLHVKEFPTARFESTRVTERRGELVLVGDLTLRGVTQHLRVSASGRKDKQRLRAATAFGVDRHDFGIEPGLPYEWVLADEVDVELSLEAARSPSRACGG